MIEREELMNRKGARKTSEIPLEVVNLLNQGEIESVNLTEWLAVNHSTLLQVILPPLGFEQEAEEISAILHKNNTDSGMKAIRTIGTHLDQSLLEKSEDVKTQIIQKLSTHTSDSVRCWAAFCKTNLGDSIESKLSYIHPFAADSHFGVREIAWMAVREDIAFELETSLDLLLEWASSDDENIRRFAIEAIRPRGVWTKQIERLKQEPQLAFTILDMLKSDPSKYVQDSVGNWLNDASKTQSEWVLDVCATWEKASNSKATVRICKKAKRTIEKAN